MKKFFMSLVAVLAFGLVASANNYTIDEQAIDATIEMAAEVSPLSLESSATDIQAATLNFGMKPQPILAFVLAVIPPTGWLAIHRMYMGTSILAVLLNILTGAGFGIVYVVDWVMLLIGVLNDDIKAYCNNGRWLMWANII